MLPNILINNFAYEIPDQIIPQNVGERNYEKSDSDSEESFHGFEVILK